MKNPRTEYVKHHLRDGTVENFDKVQFVQYEESVTYSSFTNMLHDIDGTIDWSKFKHYLAKGAQNAKEENRANGGGGMYVNLFGRGSRVATKSGEAFFWSGRTGGVGGADRALEIAKESGGTTLEGLIEARGVKMPMWDANNPASVKAWQEISAEYAAGVSGRVRAVVGAELRPGNIWENVELPALKANKNVTEVITIDPKTLAEKTIFKR